MRKTVSMFCSILLFSLLLPGEKTYLHAQAVNENISDLRKIDVVEHLGDRIPLDLEFVNASADTVKLGEYFSEGQPVVLTLAYYECPMLCTFVLNGVSEAVKKVGFMPGQDYRLLTVSIDPGETAELAGLKKKNQTAATGKQFGPEAWEFFVGNKENIDSLANRLGFKYYYDEERDEYAHPAITFIITGEGVISRYLYGIEYQESDMRLALLEASEGKIGDTLDRLLLYCFHYDPDSKSYVLFAGNVMRIGGVITMLGIGLVLAVFWRRELRRKAGLTTKHT